MKAKSIVAIALTLAMTGSVLAACGGTKLTDATLAGSTLADFSQGDPGAKVLFASDGWSNGSVFNTVWTNGNLSFSDGEMHLGITEEEKTVWVDGAEKAFSYTSGEARTTYYYGFGDYEVRMKPSDSVGTASTFFVCTGPYDVYDGTPNPWDEIDIEFLGKSPTKVQFNYYANGVGGHEHMYDLGFDASKEFHNYGFRWAEDHITWFVDGEPVYRVDKADVKKGEDFPKTAGRILMNYWCGTKDAEGWMGKFGGADGKTVDYQWVKTSAGKVNPPGGDPEAKPDPNPPATGDATDWSKIEAQDLGFANSDPFTVELSADKKSADITYTAAQGASYTNVEMPAPAAAANANTAHFKIKNNGEAEVFLRISLVNNEKDTENAASGYTKNSDVNVSATMDGVTVDTNTVNGGSYFTIPAGAEVECVIRFEGVVDRIQLMPDTSKWGDSATHAGNLHVSELKFANGSEAPAPSVPTGDPVALTFNAEEGTGYTMTAADENKSWTLTYQGLGNTYKPVTAECAALAAGNNVFSVTIKNNKDTEVTVRVDVQGTTWVDTSNGNGSGSGTDCTNQSATNVGGTGLYTDLTWGGTKITLAANEEVTLTIVYDGAAAQGAVKNILIFVDSMGGDANTHDASVTVSKFLFGKN